MTVVAKALFEATQTPAAETTMYTAPLGVRTIIDKLTGYNSTGAPAAISIKLIPNAIAPSAANQIVQKTLAAGETYTFPEVVGHVLNPQDFISILQGTANAITVRGSGREIA